MAEVFKLSKTFDRSQFEGSSCAFGVFDGVHRGLQYLLDFAQSTARDHGGASIALTFDRDPDEYFNTKHLRKLMTNQQRLKALAQSGVDKVFVLPFTPFFAAQKPLDFLNNTFGDFAPSYIHIGEDARFGAKASGDATLFEQWAKPRGGLVVAHHLQQIAGEPVTATRIRKLLADGQIEMANTLLGHRYIMSGQVVEGRGEGADMGFRTANLEVPTMLRALGDGVYSAYAHVDGFSYKAAVNVGVPPMFPGSTATVEAHMLDFDQNIYGEQIELEFLNFLRPMRKFSDVDELKMVVQNNIEWVRNNL